MPSNGPIAGAVGLALTLVTGVWALTLPLVPFAAAEDHLTGVGTVFATLVYATGGVVCHQRPERSFHPWGTQMPVCARCAGLYASAPLGTLLAWRRVRRRDDEQVQDARRPWSARRVRWCLSVAALPTVATVIGETVGLVHPTNVVRAVSALPFGLATAWVVGLGLTFGIVGPRRARAAG